MARVVVVDDEETDWRLLQLAFAEAGIPVELVWARDGTEAVQVLQTDFRRGRPVAGTKPLPTALVLLDLKMPQMSGFEVLEWCRGQPRLLDLPVVVFTSSTNPQDMEKSKRLGAREYLEKPIGFKELMARVRELSDRYVCQPVRTAKSAGKSSGDSSRKAAARGQSGPGCR